MRKDLLRISGCLTALYVFGSVAMADEAPHDSASVLDLSPATFTIQPTPTQPSTATPPAAAARKRYGAEGSTWWTIGGGAASEFDESVDFSLFGSIGYFVVDNVEVQGELGLWYFTQDSDDALGVSPIFNLRWHFLNRETWTLFGDIGIGILGATEDVPEGGSSFNFTPRIGLGWTQELSDDGTRLVLGVRWQHFSNARIFGDDENPALDEAMIYAGIIFPF